MNIDENPVTGQVKIWFNQDNQLIQLGLSDDLISRTFECPGYHVYPLSVQSIEHLVQILAESLQTLQSGAR